MQIKNIFPGWGTEFTDMSDIFEQDTRELRKILYDRKMLVFHAPEWDKLTYWKFCQLWGVPWTGKNYHDSTEKWEIVTDPENPSDPKFITSISNKISKRLGDKEMPWHADIANRVDGGIQFPHRIIYMKTVPNPAAGLTVWLDMERAYPEVHPTLRKRWEARTVVQQNWHHLGKDIIEWPSMKQQPITGRWSPRCNFHGVTDSWIIDTKLNGKSMGTGIVEELMEAMAAVPECVYTHTWAPNDMVLYDNWPFVHRRTFLDLKAEDERLMWRCNIEHDESLTETLYGK
jgi:alpha-ketoglutarate-dependent taurine dioxygenase